MTAGAGRCWAGGVGGAGDAGDVGCGQHDSALNVSG